MRKSNIKGVVGMADQGYKHLGFFVHENDLKKNELTGLTVMVVLDDGAERLTGYCPAEQHFDLDRGYFKECKPVTKEQYMNASSLYTPSRYLEEG